MQHLLSNLVLQSTLSKMSGPGALYYLIILTHGDLHEADLANLTHRPCLVEVIHYNNEMGVSGGDNA